MYVASIADGDSSPTSPTIDDHKQNNFRPGDRIAMTSNSYNSSINTLARFVL